MPMDPATTVDNSWLLWKYMLGFLGYTVVLIAFLAAVVYSVKRNPKLLKLLSGGRMSLGATKSAATANLSLEESLNLEPDKALHVIRFQRERFLLCSAGGQIQLLTGLPALTDEELVESMEEEESASFFDHVRRVIPKLHYAEEVAARHVDLPRPRH
jgi:flagellar biogenesis protein FliO